MREQKKLFFMLETLRAAPQKKSGPGRPQNFKSRRASTLFDANKFFVGPQLPLGPNRVGHIAAVIRTSGFQPRPCLHLVFEVGVFGGRILLPWRNRSRIARDSLRRDDTVKERPKPAAYKPPPAMSIIGGSTSRRGGSEVESHGKKSGCPAWIRTI